MNVFFFNDTATTEIYTLSLHDALPISRRESNRPSVASSTPRKATSSHRTVPSGIRTSACPASSPPSRPATRASPSSGRRSGTASRSEEHTSELQSRQYLVCRLLLETNNQSQT